jgi:hypothetical protein
MTSWKTARKYGAHGPVECPVDFAEIVTQLWRRRTWVLAVLALSLVVAVATVYKVSLAPPGLHTKTIERGAAETQLLVDAPHSGVGDLTRDLDPLSARALLLSQLMHSDPVVTRIAKIMGVPRGAIEAQTDNSALNVPQSQLEPGQGKRANQIAGETRLLRLTFQAVPDQPTVNVFAQSDTAGEAQKLANAAVTATRQWIADTENQQLIPDRRRTVITQLGTADTGTVNQGASRMFAALLFVAVLLIGCLLILLVNRLVSARGAAKSSAVELDARRAKVAARAAVESRNGHSQAKAKALAGGGKPSRRARRSS